jgi:hypothetical protein
MTLYSETPEWRPRLAQPLVRPRPAVARLPSTTASFTNVVGGFLGVVRQPPGPPASTRQAFPVPRGADESALVLRARPSADLFPPHEATEEVRLPHADTAEPRRATRPVGRQGLLEFEPQGHHAQGVVEAGDPFLRSTIGDAHSSEPGPIRLGWANRARVLPRRVHPLLSRVAERRVHRPRPSQDLMPRNRLRGPRAAATLVPRLNYCLAWTASACP